ncbi:MAG TPA: GNAT family N-acetyltransferase [Acidothermaceae bacterium]
MPYVIAVDDPARDDIRALVQAHREWSLQQTPPEFSFAVEPHAVAESGITLFSARSPEGELLGIGGLKELDRQYGEIKTMHTAAQARGGRIGRGVLEALLAEARRRGYTRVSLETGTGDAFQPARTLYESIGFRPSEPFGGYANTDYNVCMTLQLMECPGS